MKGILGYTKEIERRESEGVRLVPLPEINPCPVWGRVVMGVSIQMVEDSLGKGRNGRNYLQFNNFCQLRAAVLYV